MDPNRPIDNAVPARDMVTQSVKRVNATSSAASEETRAQSPPAQVAESLNVTGRLIETIRGEVARADRQEVAELKAALANGTFKVDVDALANRMVADALGEE